MKIISERKLIKMMREQYHKKLIHALNEVEVVDKRGNVIIHHGLKVRHKDSQFEYTVDDVIEDPKGDKLQIVLRLPDEPRFDPPAGTEDVITGGKVGVIKEQDPEGLDLSVPPTSEEPSIPLPGDDKEDVEAHFDSDNEVLVINQDEFESEYEVK